MTPEGRAQWLTEIKARVDNATAAPWRWGWDEDANPALVTAKVLNSDTTIPDAAYGVVGPFQRPVAVTARENQGFLDAEFIAHCREDVPRLLAYIEELEQGRDRSVTE